MFLVTVLLLATSMMFGQLKKGGLGITTAVGLAGQSSLGVAYAFSENTRLNGELEFSSVSPTGGSSQTNFGIGATLWIYQPAMENVTVSYGGGLGYGSTSSGGVSSSSISILGEFGAEYWFSPKFAWGGQLTLGFNTSGPSGAKTSTFGTGMSTSLTWWFN